MGTRSLVDVNKRISSEDDWELLTTIYRQYDGYPDGMGIDIKQAIGGKQIVNGYNDAETQLNGGGCLAAYLVGKLKKGECGGVYLYLPGQRHCGEEYIYSLYVEPNKPVKMVVFDVYGGKEIYSGAIDDFDPLSIDQGDED